MFLELCKPQPTVKLLYVTPEQLVKGGRLKDTLQQLYSRVRMRELVMGPERRVKVGKHGVWLCLQVLEVVGGLLPQSGWCHGEEEGGR